ncbi:MAG: Glu/Leu/Phe/Val dehydrogenase [Alphaproteobacteria bacterium]|nr:Glu/Leu/Phe/Val dehydrogenase [Alphaproteobacteria bacterium]
MNAFKQMAEMGHEQVAFFRNDDVGLRAIIAIHNTTLGPGLGGCRLYPYASEADALRDVLRLSRGMTYKASIAGLDLGGGKAVIIGDPGIKSEALFRAFGQAVQSLGGRYITAEDMNTNVEDMNNIHRETDFVTGGGQATGGSGDPSPVTAWGVFHGIRATLEVVFGSPDVRGRKVAIQGCGNVGRYLAGYLAEAGASLYYTDINGARVQRVIDQHGGVAIEGDEFYGLDVDVLAPCAVGGIINKHTIPLLKAPIICGGANNILNDEVPDGEALAEKGVTYGPDYVVNAGGLINVYSELKGYPRAKAMDDAANIFNTTKSIINKAKSEGITTIEAANHLAEARINAVAKLRSFHLG